MRSKAEEDQIADEYFKKFSKNRGRSQNDIEKRKKLVLERFYENEEHNEKFQRGEELYERELNHLSDLSREEILRDWTGLKMPENISFNDTLPPLPKGVPRRPKATPSYWNWADYTVVQPVQNQGGCG